MALVMRFIWTGVKVLRIILSLESTKTIPYTLNNTQKKTNLTKRQAYGRNDNVETNNTPRYYTIGFVPICYRNRSFNPFFYSHKTLFSIIPSLWIYYLFVDVGSWYCIGIPLPKR